MLCPKCGAKNEDTARFCIKCGQPLSEKVRPARASKKLLWLMGMLTLAVVCVLCVITGVLVYPHLREKAGIGVYGTYINRDNPDEYLELKADGTFYLKEVGVGFTGKWEIEGDVLRLYLSGLGLAVEGRLEGSTIVDEDGKVWVKRSGLPQTTIAPLRTTIIGKWARVGDPETSIEFFRDGTLRMTDSERSFNGNYEFIDSDTIRVNVLDDVQVSSEVADVSISGNTLTLTPRSTGKSTSFRRVR